MNNVQLLIVVAGAFIVVGSALSYLISRPTSLETLSEMPVIEQPKTDDEYAQAIKQTLAAAIVACLEYGKTSDVADLYALEYHVLRADSLVQKWRAIHASN